MRNIRYLLSLVKWMLIVNILKIVIVYGLFYAAIVVAEIEEKEDLESVLLGQVLMTKESQTNLGLKIKNLQKVNYEAEFLAYGQVKTIQSLIKLRGDYFTALATQQSAKAKLTQSQQALQRLKKLHQAGSGSNRQLQLQQSQWRSNKAELAGNRYRLATIKEKARFQWGEQSLKWLFDPDSKQYQQLINHQQFLVKITLPTGQALPKNKKSIYIEANGHRNKATPANFLMNAPYTSNLGLGQSYFFVSNDATLRIGMTVSAWITKNQQRQGFIIPVTAVVWHLGQAFVYLQIEDNLFMRQMIGNIERSSAGYFIEQELLKSKKLVEKGAQMLLSEEFRGQIPDEDDD